MEDKSTVSKELKCAEFAQNGIRETIDTLHNQATSILHLTVQWKDLGKNFAATRDSINSWAERVQSVQQSVESRYRELKGTEEELELLRESLQRRSCEIEEREREFDLKWRREMEEVRGECERLEETARGLDRMKVDVEDKLRELGEEKERLKGIHKAIEDRSEELMVIERGLRGRSSEFVLKEMELVECLMEFDLEEGRFKEKERELGLREKNYEGRISELENREKKFEMMKENFDSKEDGFDQRQRRFLRQKRKLERRLRALESNEKQFDRKDKRMWERENELELKEQQVEERSRALDLAEEEFAKRVEELESKERKFRERCKDVELKEKRCEELCKAFKMEEPIGYPYIEPECKKRKFNNTGQCKVKVESTEPDNGYKNDVDGSMDVNIHFCVTMDGKALQIFLNERCKDHDVMQDEVFVALQLSSNPTKLVLDAMQGFYPPHLKRGDTEYDENVVCRSCIILLEQLMKLSPPIVPNVRKDAMKLAFKWITQMRVDEEHFLQVLGFLLLLASYGLASAFDSDELISYLEIVAPYSQAPEILRALGLANKVHGVIQNLISKEQNLAAVRFIYAYDLGNEFPPVPLLRNCINSYKKLSRNLNSSDHIPLQEKDEATKRRPGDLKFLVKFIEEHQLESEFSLESLKESVAALEERIKNGKSVGPDFGDLCSNAQLLVPDKEMCVTPAPGAEAASMPESTVVPSRTISPETAPRSSTPFQLESCINCSKDVNSEKDYLNSIDGAASAVPSVGTTCLSLPIFPTGQENAGEVFETSRPEGKSNQLLNVAGWNAGDAAKHKESGASNGMGRKRKTKSANESDDSFEIDIDGDRDVEGMCNEESSDDGTSLQPRRSRRRRQDVSYKESDDDNNCDFVNSPTMTGGNCLSSISEEKNEVDLDGGVHKDIKSSSSAGAMHGHGKGVKQQASALHEESLANKESRIGEDDGKDEGITLWEEDNSKSEDNSELNENSPEYPAMVQYPDPEFGDFDKDKAEHCFAVNQIWAIYDPADGMPRFYAKVKKLFSPGFRLQITWLEPFSDDEVEQEWCDADLPVACGKYAPGSTEEANDILMFSHQVCVYRRLRVSYLIYPREGETWALFKSWSIKWRSDPKKHKPPYLYDYVIILSDFSENAGITVSYLNKIEGFVSLFHGTEQIGVISRKDLYKFSHRVPSFRMSGKEKEGVPIGSFELDPAALLFDLGHPVNVKTANECLGAPAKQTS